MLRLVSSFAYPLQFKENVLREFRRVGDFEDGLLEALESGSREVGHYLVGKQIIGWTPDDGPNEVEPTTILAIAELGQRGDIDLAEALKRIDSYIRRKTIRASLYKTWKRHWESRGLLFWRSAA